MLTDGTITANIPAGDLKRAREFYAEKLGLMPTKEFEGMFLVYVTSSGSQFSHGRSKRGACRLGRQRSQTLARKRSATSRWNSTPLMWKAESGMPSNGIRSRSHRPW